MPRDPASGAHRSLIWERLSVPRAAGTEYHRQGLQQQRCVVSQFRGWKSKIKAWARLVPLRAVRESVPDFLVY